MWVTVTLIFTHIRRNKIRASINGFYGGSANVTIEVFRNEILLVWQKDLNVEVIFISNFRNKDHFKHFL